MGSIVEETDELLPAELEEFSSALLRIALIAIERGETLLFRIGLEANKEGKSVK